MDERELTRAAQRGDRDAARELVRRYYPSVLRFLTTLCANGADAEELTQEAFVKALRSLRSYRGESSLRTWLHRIAFNEFAHRMRGRRLSVSVPESSSSPAFEPASILAIDLERALARLPEEYRAAFVLCEIQDLTMQEAAEVLAVPAGTIKSRLHGARQRLQALLNLDSEETKHEIRI